jgi:hypothetical protein
MNPPLSSSTPRPRSLPARLGLASWRGRFAWLAALILAALLVCWILARATPAWYRPLDPADDAVQRTAGIAQTHITVDLHNLGQRLPLGEQSWTITQDQVNALLAVKADAQDGRIADPFVIFSPGRVTFSARFRQLPAADPRGGVGSLTLAVGMTRDGGPDPMGLIQLERLHAGDLPLPRSLVAGRLQAQLPELIDAVRQAVEMQFGARPAEKARPIIEQIVRCAATGQPFPLRYKWETREFVIRELRVDDGAFTVVVAPVKPPAATSRAAGTP